MDPNTVTRSGWRQVAIVLFVLLVLAAAIVVTLGLADYLQNR